MKVTIVAGARPNFMKIAPLINAIRLFQSKQNDISFRLVHTGQHYDKNMSHSFFEELNIPDPDVNLECGGGTQAEQAASIMVKFEKEILANKPDVVLVVGDVTSTLACSIAAKKLNVEVVHVEAGIRSGDLTMPEEINRMVTDSISDHFFTTSETANNNLRHSGISENRIHFVGNTMVDTLLANLERFVRPGIFDTLGLEEKKYFVITLHRPGNVDSAENLIKLVENIIDGSEGYPILYPAHPRTKATLASAGFEAKNLHIIDPMSYLQFNYVVNKCLGVITDSGGITEETTMMGIPCITLRDSTERPETVSIGTNELIGTNPTLIPGYMSKIVSGSWKKGGIPPLWDGQTSTRIVNKLLELYGGAVS
ncbi:MAG: UDP-N-acetylglucosamine 2-epimerase (non-hydrolyzing) [Chitinophagaceae bacterium]|nr:MAG: UDP-N-acetylglucosamine 2-epimerase (non-hydrolyzing) [Chitinophagaceae bacterium]